MILFLISLYICIILHELGHLITAKLCGCGVPIYSVGFGRPILKKKIGNTVYQLGWIPFGGYCQLEDETSYSEKTTGFTNLSYRKKIIISIAGCTINILTGLIIGLIGHYYHNYNMLYFGLLSTALGLTNLIPLIPCLDGGYLLFFPLCTKIWGKEKGIIIFGKLVSISFKIVMILNFLCIPWIIKNWRKL